jgi:hypothetical protein
MTRAAIFLPIALALLITDAHAGKPGGFIMGWAPANEDAGKSIAIERAGAKVAPALLMPLDNGDSIAVDGSGVRVQIETASGVEATVGGNSNRLEIKGEVGAGEDAIALAQRLGTALNRAQPAMAADSELRVPMAVDDQNFLIRDGGPIHLSWVGGEGPFTLAFDIDGRRKDLARTESRQISFDIPEPASKRFTVIIKDQARRRVRVDFRLRDQLPAIPDGIAKAPVSPHFRETLVNAWLAQRLAGMWRVHVIRLLRNGREQGGLEQAFIALLESGRTF